MMSAPSVAIPTRRRGSVPAVLLGLLAFLVALGGAVAVFVGLLNLDKFSSYPLIVIGAAVFVGGAAWGAILTAGMYKAQSLVQRAMLGVTLTIAMTVIGGGVLENGKKWLAPTEQWSYTRFGVDTSGRILRLHYTFVRDCESPYT